MLTGRIEDIEEADLDQLVQAGAPETQTLDFKASAYPLQGSPTNEGQVKCLKDIVALANSEGGDLLLGVEEDAHGSAVGLPGISASVDQRGFDGYGQRLLQLVSSHTDPALMGVRWRAVRLSSGQHVVIVRVPKSSAAPHRLRLGDDRYWMRQERDNRIMDTNALRALILGQELTYERLEQFRKRRQARLLGNGLFFRDSEDAIVIVHSFPWRALNERRALDLSSVGEERQATCPMMTNAANVRSACCLEGMVFFALQRRPGEEIVTLFRNGVVESAAHFHGEVRGGYHLVDGNRIHDEIVSATYRAIVLQDKLGLALPATVVVTIVGRSAVRLGWRNGQLLMDNERGSGRWPEESFTLPDAVFSRIPRDRAECIDVVRSSLDVMWQAAGYDRLPVNT